jgi:hypothetical protein
VATAAPDVESDASDSEGEELSSEDESAEHTNSRALNPLTLAAELVRASLATSEPLAQTAKSNAERAVAQVNCGPKAYHRDGKRLGPKPPAESFTVRHAASVTHLPRAEVRVLRDTIRAESGQQLAGMLVVPGIGTAADLTPAKDMLLFPGADDCMEHAATALDNGINGLDTERGALTRSVAQSGRPPVVVAGATESEVFELAQAPEQSALWGRGQRRRGAHEQAGHSADQRRPHRDDADYGKRIFPGNNRYQLESNLEYRRLNGGSASKVRLDGKPYAVSTGGGW